MPETLTNRPSRNKNLYLDKKLIQITDAFLDANKRKHFNFSTLVEKLLIRHLRSSGVKIPEHLQ